MNGLVCDPMLFNAAREKYQRSSEGFVERLKEQICHQLSVLRKKVVTLKNAGSRIKTTNAFMWLRNCLLILH